MGDKKKKKDPSPSPFFLLPLPQATLSLSLRLSSQYSLSQAPQVTQGRSLLRCITPASRHLESLMLPPILLKFNDCCWLCLDCRSLPPVSKTCPLCSRLLAYPFPLHCNCLFVPFSPPPSSKALHKDREAVSNSSLYWRHITGVRSKLCGSINELWIIG